jgi:Dolichyl-phosphate-mannose-protein mannosyltransferase
MFLLTQTTESVQKQARLLEAAYRAAVCLLLLILAIELVVPAHRQSAAYDEGCHAFAGYSYWTRGDFGINPEHPPAVKLLATLPLLSKSLRYPPSSPIPFFKAECFERGRDFVYANTVDADTILFRSRIVAAFLTLLAALLTFAVAYQMFGAVAALVALLLFVFEPNLLAHGSLITTDMGMTLFLLATVYAFYRYVKHPSVPRLVLAGLAAGLVFGAKFSAVLVLPILPLLALSEVVLRPQGSKLAEGGAAKRALRLAAALIVVAAIAFAVLWSFYAFKYTARPNGSNLAPPLNAYVGQLNEPRTEKLILGIARHHLLPEAYLYGLCDVFITPRYMTSYVFGKLYRHGQWFYFPGAILIKSTLGFLLLFMLIPVAIATRRGQPWREFLFLAIPAAVYLAAAMRSNFNIGVRHILPIYPFLIIFAAYAARSLARSSKVWLYAISTLLIFHVASSVHAFPNYLPYSNEVWGGPSQTYKFLTDSNVDWGQQLKQTKAYLDSHGINDCWFDYLARPVADPGYYGIQCRALQNAFGSPVPTPSHVSGVVLISATELTPALWGPGKLNPYLQFVKLRPDDSIANGIFVFRGDFDIPLASATASAGTAWRLLNGQDNPSNAQVIQALIEAQAAVSLSPDICAVCQETLGDVLMKLNRKDEARAAYQKGLADAQALYPEFQDGEIASLKSKLKQ